MRAGPLSHTTIIDMLNNGFVNTWVLNRNVETLKAKTSDLNTSRLAKAVLAARQKGSPVDSLVFSTDLDLLGCEPANALLSAYREAPERYRNFLTGALAKVKRK